MKTAGGRKSKGTGDGRGKVGERNKSEGKQAQREQAGEGIANACKHARMQVVWSAAVCNPPHATSRSPPAYSIRAAAAAVPLPLLTRHFAFLEW
jgi:hypothetical protein